MSRQDWISLLQSWDVTATVVVWLSLVAAIYVRGWWVYRQRKSSRFPAARLLSFLAGLAIVFVALQSPLDVAAAFSLQVHMVQHLLLIIVAPPLLLYGTPMLPMIAGLPKSLRDDWLTPFATWQPLRRLLGILVQPAIAWVLFTVTLWVWHSPQLYDLALQSGAWHRVEHACFLSASMLFWWPVFEPYPTRSKRSRWTLVPYLFLAGVQGTALAALLTFAPRVIYPYYESVPNIWGLAPLTDQSLAGAIMWVPMAFAFLVGMVYVVGEQFSTSPQTLRATPQVIRRNASRSGSPRRKPWVNARRLIASSWWLNQIAHKPIRRMLQVAMLLLAALVIIDGVTGPQVSAINLAGVLPWIHWRGMLVIVLVLGGNFFCMVCPFTTFRTTTKRLFKPVHRWPKRLQNKWIALAMLVVFFWSYEAFALWDRPFATALIVIGYFAAVFVIDALFMEAPFCKFVCPIGQFNFVHSLFSPTQVAIADGAICNRCTTKDCIAGNANSPGCQTKLFQPKKQGNMDCTFCMDCVDACPHDNVAVLSINRTEDLVNDSHRSGVGRFGQRFDLAAMIVLLFFAALVNAAWMTAPVLALEDSFVRRLGLGRLPVMIAGLLFVMIGLPIFLMQAVATTSNRASGSDGGDDAVRANIAKFAPSLIPLSLSMWLAHYCFHFATSFDGWRLASERASADWAGTAFEFGPIAMACCKANSVPWLLPGELVVLGIGLCASFAVAYRIGDRGDATPRDRAAIIPWVLLMLTFYAASVWVLLQPMQMRGALTVGM